jgi:dipeptidyl aminopeptidase/acylaminoacyl peptidase
MLSNRPAWAGTVGALLTVSLARAQEQRPMEVNDVLALEQLGPVTASPDGQWVAVVITRARTTSESYRNFIDAWYHSDIWLVPRHGEPHNITNGISDGSGFWDPVWSPDGKRLALLSTKGGDNVRPYVYELASGTLRRLTDRGADLWAFRDRYFGGYAMLWSDNTTVVCALLAQGAPAAWHSMTNVKSYGTAMLQWQAAEKGTVATGSVLASGPEITDTQPPEGALLAIDVRSRRSTIVARGNFRLLLPSPTGRDLALIAQTGRVPPRPDRKIPYGDRALGLQRTRLALLSLRKESSPRWIDRIHDPLNATLTSPHTWSPDGAAFAVVGKQAADDERATSLSIVSATEGRVLPAAVPSLDVTATVWSDHGKLLILARSRGGPTAKGDTARFDWWTLDSRVRPTAYKLTAGMKIVPQALVRSPGSNALLGIAAGDLWSVDADGRKVENLTAAFEPRIESLVWPNNLAQAGESQELIIKTAAGDLYAVTSASSRVPMRLFPRPSKTAALAEYRPQPHLSIFSDQTPNGTFLWMADGDSTHFEKRIELNPHLGQLSDPQRMRIAYRGGDGDSLQALLLLPVRYQPGTRYPLIAWVYPSTSADQWAWLFDKDNPGWMNLNLLSSHGYAVLIPSIPIKALQDGGDPYIDIPKAVLPAIDKVIDLGIADGERLGVAGHSYGGYAVYTLISYTQRFRAAVALAGPSDLVSWYGGFEVPSRYDANVHEILLPPTLLESGPVGMADTPWGNLWRYLRNTPLYYVDRVNTPVMIVHGDMDGVPMQQAEEFFTALYRQGKEARLLRYWGEGHVIESPANIRDLWEKMLAWYDEHLGLSPMPPKGSLKTARQPARAAERPEGATR